ncbi:MAG: hypothetical protein AB7V18_05600 [Pyrinomonadaceae bacterium]
MVKQTSTTIARNIDKPLVPMSERASVLQAKQTSRHPADEIILSLANAYENKRARQVTEWERVQANRWQRAA